MKAEKLAADHWKYLEGLLESHNVDEKAVEAIGFHYRTAMVHGFKHGVEASRKWIFAAFFLTGAALALFLLTSCAPINLCHVHAVATWNILPANIWKRALHYDGAEGLSHIVILYETPDGTVYLKDGDGKSIRMGPKELRSWNPLNLARLHDKRAVSAYFDGDFVLSGK